jgi:hypothetical protein
METIWIYYGYTMDKVWKQYGCTLDLVMQLQIP